MKGFEPTTLGTTILYSNRLSYIHHLDPFPNRCANIRTFFYSPKFFAFIFAFSCKYMFFRRYLTVTTGISSHRVV